ncbi:MAG: hypothetical protein H6642_15200 [Caldilineaceae bacterium]|nr:hypothetical protein [Caldilineaceae bacterium]
MFRSLRRLLVRLTVAVFVGLAVRNAYQTNALHDLTRRTQASALRQLAVWIEPQADHAAVPEWGEAAAREIFDWVWSNADAETRAAAEYFQELRREAHSER